MKHIRDLALIVLLPLVHGWLAHHVAFHHHGSAVHHAGHGGPHIHAEAGHVHQHVAGHGEPHHHDETRHAHDHHPDSSEDHAPHPVQDHELSQVRLEKINIFAKFYLSATALVSAFSISNPVIHTWSRPIEVPPIRTIAHHQDLPRPPPLFSVV